MQPPTYLDAALADVARAHQICNIPITRITPADLAWLDTPAGQRALHRLDRLYQPDPERVAS